MHHILRAKFVTFLHLSSRLGRKRPYSPPLITSTPIQNDPNTTPVEDGTAHAVRGVKEEGSECEAGAPPPVKKRLDYLQWEEYFMAVAFLSAQRSKDPNSQVTITCTLCAYDLTYISPQVH